MNAIEVSNLNKEYAGFSLTDVNLSLPSGSIMGLAGENGAGKSTLIKLIMNVIPRTSGKVSVLGVDNQSREFVSLKEDIGIVLDEAYYPETLTPKEVRKVMRATYKNWDDQTFSDYLKRLSLPDNREFKEFSRGMKMKLAIAVALSHSPKLLILDEATSGLDPMVRDEILDVFNDFTRYEDHSILMSSHIVSDMEKICDYIAFIHMGRLILCEEKDRLLEEYALLKLNSSQLASLRPEAIHGKKDTSYGAEVLVRRSEIPASFRVEHTNLEDIILFLAKEEKR